MAASLIDPNVGWPTGTAFGNQRKIDRCQNGVVWMVINEADAVASSGRLYYSTDEGATWTRGPDVPLVSTTATTNYTGHVSIFIDLDDYLHVAFRDKGNGWICYVRGVPNAARTSWTWEAAVNIYGVASAHAPDLVAHREGTGWAVHIVGSRHDNSTVKSFYQRVMIAADGSRTYPAAITHTVATANANPGYPAVDFHHIGDGKTVKDGLPHVFMVWSNGINGGGYGARYRNFTYSAGSWTAGTNRALNDNMFLPENNTVNGWYWQGVVFDGTRVVVGGTYFHSDFNGARLLLADIPVDNSAVTYLSSPTPNTVNESTGTRHGSLSYNDKKNPIWIGANTGSGTLLYEWDRATSTLLAGVVLDSAATDAEFVSVKRGTSAARQEFVYRRTGPQDVFYDSIVYNTAPNAPTLDSPVGSAVIDRTQPLTLDWTFSDPDAGDTQSAAEPRYRIVGEATWTTINLVQTGTSHTLAGGTLAAGDYEWQARTADAAGEWGPFSASAFFTAATPPNAPTITAPTDGQTIATEAFTVTWSYPTQSAYRVRRVADNAGVPDTATVYADTGEVTSSSARSRTLTFDVNDRYEHVQVQIRDDNGLLSTYASVRVRVSYTTPAVPYVRVSPDVSKASISVDVVNGTAWGYGGSGSAKNAASAALIDLAALGVARVLWLPGTSGNYVSTPDRNMLPAHADSFEDGTTGGWGVANVTAANSTAWAAHGTRSLQLTPSSTTNADAHANRSYTVGAGVTLTISATIRLAAAQTGTIDARARRIVVYAWDSANGLLSPAPVAQSAQAANAAGETRLSVTFTTPANTAYITPRLYNGAMSGGGDVWWDAVQVEQASSASAFTPSLRVTGDLDLRAHVALEDWTPGTIQTLVAKWGGSGQGGYALSANTTGTLLLQWSVDGSAATSVYSTVATGFTDGARKHVRATLDVNNGAATPVYEVRFYTSDDGVTWTQLGATVAGTATTSVFATNATLIAGTFAGNIASQLVKGKVLAASVRAGIDGPVVAAYDATAHSDTTYTDSTGKAWTVSRSGDATAEIVDRTTWAFTGSEYLTLPDRDALDFGAGEAFTAVVGYATRTNTSGQRFLDKRGASGVGYGLYVWSSGTRSYAEDGTGLTECPTTSSTSMLDGAWHVIAGGRVADGTVTHYRDAVESTATPARAGSTSNAQALVIGATSAAASAIQGLASWVALFARVLTAAEHAALAAWDGSIADEPSFLRTGAALYVNAADTQQAQQYAARNLVLNLARTADEGGVASDLPQVTENRVWRRLRYLDGAWVTERIATGVAPDGVYLDRTAGGPGWTHEYEVEAVGDNGTAVRSGWIG